MDYLIENLTEAFIQFSIIGIPLVLIAFFRKSVNPLIALAILGSAFFFDIIVLTLPRALSFSPFQWNWLGKAGEFTWPLIVVYIYQLLI